MNRKEIEQRCTGREQRSGTELRPEMVPQLVGYARLVTGVQSHNLGGFRSFENAFARSINWAANCVCLFSTIHHGYLAVARLAR